MPGTRADRQAVQQAERRGRQQFEEEIKNRVAMETADDDTCRSLRQPGRRRDEQCSTAARPVLMGTGARARRFHRRREGKGQRG